MNKTEISNAIECWPKEQLIDFIYNLHEVMYQACKVSLDLCDTCDLHPEECGALVTTVDCPNIELRERIQKIRPVAVNSVERR